MFKKLHEVLVLGISEGGLPSSYLRCSCNHLISEVLLCSGVVVPVTSAVRCDISVAVYAGPSLHPQRT